jgi:hypothetical protein
MAMEELEQMAQLKIFSFENVFEHIQVYIILADHS